MDPFLQAALLAASTEAIRAVGVEGKLNGIAVDLIPSDETAGISIADGGFTTQGTLDFLIAASQWAAYRLERISANVLEVDGETYRIKNAHVVPGLPTVRLSAAIPGA
ncbi:MAG: hypothetical protein RLZZ244_1849 [Verrucomicrobiota bacterium]|jgi:hypothetical protein